MNYNNLFLNTWQNSFSGQHFFISEYDKYNKYYKIEA